MVPIRTTVTEYGPPPSQPAQNRLPGSQPWGVIFLLILVAVITFLWQEGRYRNVLDRSQAELANERRARRQAETEADECYLNLGTCTERAEQLGADLADCQTHNQLLFADLTNCQTDLADTTSALQASRAANARLRGDLVMVNQQADSLQTVVDRQGRDLEVARTELATSQTKFSFFSWISRASRAISESEGESAPVKHSISARQRIFRGGLYTIGIAFCLIGIYLGTLRLRNSLKLRKWRQPA